MHARLFRLALSVSLFLVGTPRASAQAITEFPLPTLATSPNDITAGPDGNLWFTQFGGSGPNSTIGRITPLGVVTEFPIVLPPAGQGFPAVSIVVGPDGNLWFTISAPLDKLASDFAAIGRITPSGVITVFETLPGSEPFGIAAGPDGALWFTERNAIARITTAGVVTRFAISTPPGDIDAGPDGNLWFIEGATNKIGRMTTAGVLTEFPIPTPQNGGGTIAVGSDGNLWFTEIQANKIGRITPAGLITEFPLPTAASGPLGITAGPDGNMWFTEIDGNKLGRITPSGVITEFPVPSSKSGLAGITASPGGTMWFTEFYARKIGRITLIPLALGFFTLEPCRLVDTRGEPEPLGGPGLAPNSTRTLALIGRCGIPVFAKTIALNVTVIQPTAEGYLTLFSGDSLPPTSTINFSAGQVRANNALVSLPTDGSRSIRIHNGSGGTTHFALDIAGYFD